MALVALLSVAAFDQAAAAPIDRDLVPDSATAIKLAGAILETWMGKKQFVTMIRKAPLRAELEGDVWSVYAYPNVAGREEHQPGGKTAVSVTTGGGEPVIEISRHDAQVRNIYFAR